MIYQVQIPIGSLPVNLVLVGNAQRGQVVFVRVATMSHTIFDVDLDGNIQAMFDNNEFDIFGDGVGPETFRYNTLYDYKEIPAMLEWLKKQNLQIPENVVFG